MWQSICADAALVKHLFSWQIGNGRSVNLLIDLYIDNISWNKKLIFINSNLCHGNMKVAELINAN